VTGFERPPENGWFSEATTGQKSVVRQTNLPVSSNA
jgi:hypothetical protein